MSKQAPPKPDHTLVAKRELSRSTYVLCLDRHGLPFEPGQYLNVGPAGKRGMMREYSIYSPNSADCFELLIKEVEAGSVSRQLRKTQVGDKLRVEGPFGFFLMPPGAQSGKRPVYLIATGTGISPMRCFAQSFLHLDYTLIHGVRTLADRTEYEHFDPRRVHCCVSREEIPDDPGLFRGRVTDYLKSIQLSPTALYYLCGSCDMIYDVYDILKARDVPRNQVKTEVYF